jgi:hypothetical protein
LPPGMPEAAFPDDSGFGAGDVTNDTVGPPSQSLTASEWGAENSENPIFASFPLAATYDENADDTYDFTSVVQNSQTGALLASDTMQVVVGAGAPTPEAATFGLIGLGLGVIGLVARKRRA